VAELDAARSDVRKQFRVTVRKVLAKRAQLAFSDIGNVLDLSDPARPRLKPYHDIPPEARRAIQSVAVTKDGVRVRMADQNAALSALEARLGLRTAITPLDSLLAALPPRVADGLRVLLAHPSPPEDSGRGRPLPPARRDDQFDAAFALAPLTSVDGVSAENPPPRAGL